MKKLTAEKAYFEALGRAVFDGFCVALSHPNVRVDMCPEFDNLLILAFGREVYKTMRRKDVQKLWAHADYLVEEDTLNEKKFFKQLDQLSKKVHSNNYKKLMRRGRS